MKDRPEWFKHLDEDVRIRAAKRAIENGASAQLFRQIMEKQFGPLTPDEWAPWAEAYRKAGVQ